MGEHASEKDFLPFINDAGDQPVFVAANVKDRQVALEFCGFEIGVREGGAHFVDALKVGTFENRVPGGQWFLAVWVCFPEGSEGFAGNDMHLQIRYMSN